VREGAASYQSSRGSLPSSTSLEFPSRATSPLNSTVAHHQLQRSKERSLLAVPGRVRPLQSIRDLPSYLQ
jgi:hypothetical protein